MSIRRLISCITVLLTLPQDSVAADGQRIRLRDTLNGQFGGVRLLLAGPGVGDKSYQLTGALGVYESEYHLGLNVIVPKTLESLELQYGGQNHEPDFRSIAYNHSDFVHGVDVAAQFLVQGTNKGEAASIKWDLTPERRAAARALYVEGVEKHPELAAVKAENEKLADTAIDKLDVYLKSLHVSAAAGISDIDAQATVLNLGAALSKRLWTTGDSRLGITGEASLLGLYIQPRGAGDYGVAVPCVGLSIQDPVPSRKSGRTWRWKAGVEETFRTRNSEVDSLAVVIRIRIGPLKELTSNAASAANEYAEYYVPGARRNEMTGRHKSYKDAYTSIYEIALFASDLTRGQPIGGIKVQKAF